MSDQKNQQFRPGLYHGEANRNGQSNGTATATSSAATNDRRSSKQPDRRSSEQQGWEAYRKWLSRDNTQPAQRSPLDASIYSWRGYNKWADKVRQTWKADEPVDS
jgi:hypothetical protein